MKANQRRKKNKNNKAKGHINKTVREGSQLKGRERQRDEERQREMKRETEEEHMRIMGKGMETGEEEEGKGDRREGEGCR